MKKSQLIVLVAALVSITACSKKKDAPQASDTPAPAEKAYVAGQPGAIEFFGVIANEQNTAPTDKRVLAAQFLAEENQEEPKVLTGEEATVTYISNPPVALKFGPSVEGKTVVGILGCNPADTPAIQAFLQPSGSAIGENAQSQAPAENIEMFNFQTASEEGKTIIKVNQLFVCGEHAFEGEDLSILAGYVYMKDAAITTVKNGGKLAIHTNRLHLDGKNEVSTLGAPFEGEEAATASEIQMKVTNKLTGKGTLFVKSVGHGVDLAETNPPVETSAAELNGNKNRAELN